MAEKACVKRLQKEYRALCKEPVSHVVARPTPNDILEWHDKMPRPAVYRSLRPDYQFGHMSYIGNFNLNAHHFVLEGSEGTPFAGGYYHGKIKFPPEYPYKPPGISMITPNGRFKTQKKICLSMTDFHPESWNPMWSVSSILNGLLSFMMDNSPTTGSVTTTVAEKQKLAKASLAFNCKNATFRKLFPEFVEKYEQKQLAEQPAKDQAAAQVPNDEDNSRPLLNENGRIGGVNRLEPAREVKNRRQSFSTWVLLLVFFILGGVMALPLLQL